MVTPAAEREAVAHLVAGHGMSEVVRYKRSGGSFVAHNGVSGVERLPELGGSGIDPGDQFPDQRRAIRPCGLTIWICAMA